MVFESSLYRKSGAQGYRAANKSQSWDLNSGLTGSKAHSLIRCSLWLEHRTNFLCFCRLFWSNVVNREVNVVELK